LFVSTLAVLAYTGWYTGEYFANSVGWPLALIGFGLLMIGVSALAVRIDRQFVRRRES
jgi:Zn-dependent protease with chaperone function